MTPELPLWPHQKCAIRDILDLIRRGSRRIILQSPTGGGKSRIVGELIKLFLLEREWRSIVYSNRRLLVEQLKRTLSAAGLDVGMRAAGHHYDPDCPVQVASIQTEDSRVYKKKGHITWELFPANVVFVDEAHLQTGDVARGILRDYYEGKGAVIILVTATPVDMEGMADVIVTAGTNSQLRECGALVPALTWGPEEPDLRCIKRTAFGDDGELSEEEQRTLMGKVGKDGKPTVKLQRLFGRVFEEFEVRNPDRRPTILFAPGVPESRWFAEQFTERGVPAGHIDGMDIWVPGAGEVKSSQAAREELLEMHRNGKLQVLCNRFVLREGIDCPWLSHGIFATPFGSLSSYLQSGGRLLRSFPGLEHVTISDHGGNWWRHGSLNEDREWRLDCTSREIAGARAERLRNKEEPEPFRCPVCGMILRSLNCVCGLTLNPKAKTRPVVQEDGSLKVLGGDIFRPRRTELREDTQELWNRVFHGSKRNGRTFAAAIGWFYQQHRYWPPANLQNMPKNAADKWRKVSSVKKEDLI